MAAVTGILRLACTTALVAATAGKPHVANHVRTGASRECAVGEECADVLPMPTMTNSIALRRG
jgi:hypothetical protein